MADIDLPLILIVEDEPLLLMDAADLIGEAGFRVLIAHNADEAIALLQQHDDIRLVFSDIDMPGSMDGLAMVAQVRDRWPPIAIILTSGHTRPAIGEMPTGAEFFAKPYNDRRVTDAMHRLAA